MDGFTFFKSYYESAQHLSDKDQAQFYKLIMDYMFTGEEPQLQGHLMGFWLLTKPNLDTSKSRAKAGQTKSKENQKKIKPKSKPKPSPLEDKERDKDKDIKKDIKKDFTFILSKVTQFKNLSLDYRNNLFIYAEKQPNGLELSKAMIDYHQSNGKGFKDWSAAFRTWVRNDKKFSKQTFKSNTNNSKSALDKVFGDKDDTQNIIDVEVGA